MSHWSDPRPEAPLIVSPIDAVAEIDRELKHIADEKKRRSLNKIETAFPEFGEYRRDLYPRHLEYFRAGNFYRSRLFSAGNRVGKTFAGGFEMACHLSNEYPDWWPGRRFDYPITAWACGTSNEKTKGIVQAELLGKLEKDDNVGSEHIGLGTGMIPARLIASVEFHPQVRGAIKTAWVRTKSGKRSSVAFKSYEQGSEAYEGEAVDFIWLDESPSLEIYVECIMRTMTRDGCVSITATPLNGLTELVQQFMPDGVVPEWETCKCGKQLMAIGHACPIQ